VLCGHDQETTIKIEAKRTRSWLFPSAALPAYAGKSIRISSHAEGLILPEIRQSAVEARDLIETVQPWISNAVLQQSAWTVAASAAVTGTAAMTGATAYFLLPLVQSFQNTIRIPERPLPAVSRATGDVFWSVPGGRIVHRGSSVHRFSPYHKNYCPQTTGDS